MTCNKVLPHSSKECDKEITLMFQSTETIPPWCQQTFNRISRLDNHPTKATPVTCEKCNKNFCGENRLQQHIRTDHVNNGFQEDGMNISSSESKYPDTGHTASDEKPLKNISVRYRLTRKIGKIGRKLIYNGPQILSTAIWIHCWRKYGVMNAVFSKISIRFGSILYDTVSQVYLYYLVSTNHLLLDRAMTISTNREMTDFYNEIVSLDIANTYYLNSPTSGWILAGLPNVEIRVYRMRGIPIGPGVELPECVKKSKSIIGLTRDENNGHAHDENSCLFRCLELYFGAPLHRLEREANHLKEKFEKHTRVLWGGC